MHPCGVQSRRYDSRRLTFRFGSRDMRLTDVHGEVAYDLIA